MESLFTVPKNLLTTENAKTVKGEKDGYKTYILYMSSHTKNSAGKNLCPFASESCAKACLDYSGLGGLYKTVKKSRENKANYFIYARQQFLQQLKNEIAKIVQKQTDLIPVIRLNGTTDINWEKMYVDGVSIIESFPTVQFYDYTKNLYRFDKPLPSNYHLTFSRSETNHELCFKMLKKGVNVAMVFKNRLPQTYKGYKVIDGDENDLRFVNEKGVIIGLKYKAITAENGKEINDDAIKSGFVVPTYIDKGKVIATVRNIYKKVPACSNVTI
jgi:hypothetical protein